MVAFECAHSVYTEFSPLLSARRLVKHRGLSGRVIAVPTGRVTDTLTFHFTRLRFRQGTAIVILSSPLPREGPSDRSPWQMNATNERSTVETFPSLYHILNTGTATERKSFQLCFFVKNIQIEVKVVFVNQACVGDERERSGFWW